MTDEQKHKAIDRVIESASQVQLEILNKQDLAMAHLDLLAALNDSPVDAVTVSVKLNDLNSWLPRGKKLKLKL